MIPKTAEEGMPCDGRRLLLLLLPPPMAPAKPSAWGKGGSDVGLSEPQLRNSVARRAFFPKREGRTATSRSSAGSSLKPVTRKMYSCAAAS